MSVAPKLSVIMPVYNSDKYLSQAIESVLNQTFYDFEFIIINDGSIDKSLKIIKKYMAVDERIKLIDRENRGIVSSLNEAIFISRGEYIARMDGDDICFPERFAEQLRFMECNELDLCGTWVEPFNERRKHNVSCFPISHADIVITSIFYCCINHPSAMIKRKVFDSLKYTDEAAEDYKLWCDIIINGFKVGNCPKVLLRYRLHSGQMIRSKTEELRSSAERVSKKLTGHLGGLEIETHSDFVKYNSSNKYSLFKALARNIDLLLKKHGASKNCKNSILSRLYFKSDDKTPALYLLYLYETFSFDKKINKEFGFFFKSIVVFIRNKIFKKR
ncbi:glycosyltransferase family 2 protein [Denitrificimonas caeni]|uniref:Glycosyltransferase n=1 Tax=Denitrificimonas caeni TaxID=521720 RepID=A0AAE9VQ10_9GAMM|nr:glycosyltransferase [Denitrificimonas caeni]WBE26033.1 glycosyltransferase [Denitrificimonas caeni]